MNDLKRVITSSKITLYLLGLEVYISLMMMSLLTINSLMIPHCSLNFMKVILRPFKESLNYSALYLGLAFPNLNPSVLVGKSNPLIGFPTTFSNGEAPTRLLSTLASPSCGTFSSGHVVLDQGENSY